MLVIDKGNKPDSPNSAEAGLTLIECLVAIVVIALTSAAIAPMMIFSVATRVQNQKSEQALQLAQAEIDQVRLVVEQGGDYGGRLDDLGLLELDPAIASTAFDALPPVEFIGSTATIDRVVEARMLDTDGDGDNDFAIQQFRTEGIEIAPQTPGVVSSTPVVFDVGVRVYDARAQSSLTGASPVGLVADAARLTFTSGEGDRRRRPLAVLYTQVVQGDRDGSLCQYWEFTGSTPTDLQC